MNPRVCKTCKTEVRKFWVNPINKNMLVGRCPTCKKTVNLGNPDVRKPAPVATGGAAAVTPVVTRKTREEKARPAVKKQVEKITVKKREPETVTAPAAAARRSGFGAKLADFFGID